MTLAEYNRLLDLAARAPGGAGGRAGRAPSSRAPISASPSIARSARGVFNLAGQVLQSGVSRVPLLSAARR